MAISKHQGKWRVEIWKHGKRVKYKSGLKTKREALLAEEEAKENLSRTNSDFMTLCSSRLRELKRRRTPRWFYENHLLIKKLIEKWGKKSEIKREDVESFLDKVAKKSNHNANSHLRMIKALFQHGVDRGWIKDNPAEKIKAYPIRNQNKYIPTLEDIKLVLDKAEPEDRLYLLVMAHTLGRMSAVNNLKWEDVHEDFISLYTRKTRNSDVKEIKVPMNKVLKQAISQIPKNGNYLFINPKTGKPYIYRKKLLRGLCKKAEVKYFSYHSLRHYGASKLDSARVPLTTIQALLGHSRATTTDFYLQSLRGSQQEAVKELEDLE